MTPIEIAQVDADDVAATVALIKKVKPDLVFACYGMNDGIYLPLADDRFGRFKDGMRKLHDEVTKGGFVRELGSGGGAAALVNADFFGHGVLGACQAAVSHARGLP